MIGCEVEAAPRSAVPAREVAIVVRTVEVDLSDGASNSPTEPVGPLYSRERARRLAVPETSSPSQEVLDAPHGLPGIERFRYQPVTQRSVSLLDIGRIKGREHDPAWRLGLPFVAAQPREDFVSTAVGQAQVEHDCRNPRVVELL